MDVCYNKLFKILIDKNLKKVGFTKMAGINQNTSVKLFKNKFVSMEVLVKIYRGLNCIVDDVLEVLLTKRMNNAVQTVMMQCEMCADSQ